MIEIQNGLFRIICLKRTVFENSAGFEYTSDWHENSNIVYWKPNAAGYTSDIEQAGLYSLEDLKRINGKFLDWLIEPAWS